MRINFIRGILILCALQMHRIAKLIHSQIDERGLPKRNFILCSSANMISWDSQTGEVKTIEYGARQAKEVIEFWFDETADIKTIVREISNEPIPQKISNKIN